MGKKTDRHNTENFDTMLEIYPTVAEYLNALPVSRPPNKDLYPILSTCHGNQTGECGFSIELVYRASIGRERVFSHVIKCCVEYSETIGKLPEIVVTDFRYSYPDKDTTVIKNSKVRYGIVATSRAAKHVIDLLNTYLCNNGMIVEEVV